MRQIPLIIVFTLLLCVSVGSFGVGVYLDFFSGMVAPAGKSGEITKVGFLYLVALGTAIVSILIAIGFSDGSHKPTSSKPIQK